MSVVRRALLSVATLVTAGCHGDATTTATAQGEIGGIVLEPPPCGSHPVAQSLGIEGPEPPRAYTPPALAVHVNTTSTLRAALASPIATNIVVENGTYPPPTTGPFYANFGAAHRLFAEGSGLVRLEFGLRIGPTPGTAGAEIRGIVIDIDDESHAVPIHVVKDVLDQSAGILVFGPARDVRIRDVKVFGRDVVDQGINIGQVDGAVLERVRIFDVRRMGILVGRNGEPVGPTESAPILRDVWIDGVQDPAYEMSIAATPFAWGRQLHGLHLETTSVVERARIRNVANTGLWIGNAADTNPDSRLSDIDVDTVNVSTITPGIGIGFERQVLRAQLTNFCVGLDVTRGVHVEWGHAIGVDTIAGHQGKGAATPIPSDGIDMRRGLVRASLSGIYVGAWTTNTNIEQVHIEEASWAGIGLRDNEGVGTDTTLQNITFDNLAATCPLTYEHPNQHAVAVDCEPVPPPAFGLARSI